MEILIKILVNYEYLVKCSLEGLLFVEKVNFFKMSDFSFYVDKMLIRMR